MTDTQTISHHYAGFGSRFVAMLIDVVLMNLIIMVALEIFAPSSFSEEKLASIASGGYVDPRMLQDLMHYAIMASVISLAVVFLYDTVFPATKWMGTPGKKLLGIAITDMAGEKISFGQSVGRHAAKFVSALPLMIGFFTPLFTQKKQAIHDMMSKTLVLKAAKPEQTEVGYDSHSF